MSTKNWSCGANWIVSNSKLVWPIILNSSVRLYLNWEIRHLTNLRSFLCLPRGLKLTFRCKCYWHDLCCWVKRNRWPNERIWPYFPLVADKHSQSCSHDIISSHSNGNSGIGSSVHLLHLRVMGQFPWSLVLWTSRVNSGLLHRLGVLGKLFVTIVGSQGTSHVIVGLRLVVSSRAISIRCSTLRNSVPRCITRCIQYSHLCVSNCLCLSSCHNICICQHHLQCSQSRKNRPAPCHHRLL